MMDNEKLPDAEGLIASYVPEGDEEEVKEDKDKTDASEVKTKAKLASLKEKATSLEHLLDHQPPNPECPACCAAKNAGRTTLLWRIPAQPTRVGRSYDLRSH